MGNDLWEQAVAFHGHSCPGLAIGFAASLAASQLLHFSLPAATLDEDLVCVTENDACGVDAVQFLTGCTLGKGNLIYRGTGKMAFSFFNRKNGESVRLYLKPSPRPMERDERQAYLLNTPPLTLFQCSKPSFPMPERARLFSTIPCEVCGEGAPEYKMRLVDGKKVCLDCFQDYNRGW